MESLRGVAVFIRKDLSSTNEFENSNFLVVSLIDLSIKIGGFCKPPDSNDSHLAIRT
jgi:hypothetical protein